MQRRNFIKINSLLSGGWILAQMLPVKVWGAPELQCFQPSPLVKLCSDGKIIVYVIKQESGQGVQTSLPMILAEELEADLNDIVVEALPFDAKNGGAYSTGGSTSVLREFEPLRKAGASARMVLVEAAAKKWNISTEVCKAEKSGVTNTVTNQRLAYKDLISEASQLPLPKEVALKNYKDFKIIGKGGQKKNNLKQILTGKMVYGIDYKLPGMRYAVIVRCPVMGGKPKSWDQSRLSTIPGIEKVFEIKEMGEQIENRAGVAIVAQSHWSALKAQQRLKVEWDIPAGATAVNSNTYKKQQTDRLAKAADVFYDEKGGTAKEGLLPDAGWYSATYHLPFLAHATMEPPNCIAAFKEGKFEIWGGFQNPGKVASAGAPYFGLKATDVFINLFPMGGGFGRKLSADYGAEAMQVAKAVDGPVQLLYTRADDIKFDVFRPASVHQLSAKLNATQLPEQWFHHNVISPVGDKFMGKKGNPAWLTFEVGGGAHGDLYYDVKQYRTGISRTESPVGLGWWRAVNFTYNNVVIECFIDELAKKAGKNPLDYRLELLKNFPAGKKMDGALYQPERMVAVLNKAADAIGWRNKRPAGRGLGIACCFYNHAKAYTAHAFEVSVNKDKKITIHRAVVATDAGTIIDPDGFANQVEGGFVWGLSAAVKSEITISNGAVDQSSFFDFEVCRMPDVPKLEIHVLPSTAEPGGAGETSVPSVMPALMNAVAAATGKRVRELPLKKAGYSL